MPEPSAPSVPSSQLELRSVLEHLLNGLKLEYHHEDRFWESGDGREATYGWGTRIERAAGREPLRVWFDGLDEDIAIHGDRRRGEYREWLDLTELPVVLDEIRTALIEILPPNVQ